MQGDTHKFDARGSRETKGNLLCSVVIEGNLMVRWWAAFKFLLLLSIYFREMALKYLLLTLPIFLLLVISQWDDEGAVEAAPQYYHHGGGGDGWWPPPPPHHHHHGHGYEGRD